MGEYLDQWRKAGDLSEYERRCIWVRMTKEERDQAWEDDRRAKEEAAKPKSETPVSDAAYEQAQQGVEPGSLLWKVNENLRARGLFESYEWESFTDSDGFIRKRKKKI